MTIQKNGNVRKRLTENDNNYWFNDNDVKFKLCRLFIGKLFRSRLLSISYLRET